MTARQLYTTYQTLADSAGQPHLSPPKFARLYWVCQIDYLKELARQPSTELVKHALRPFKRSWSGVGTLIQFNAITPAALAIRSVRADFDLDRVDMPVTPIDSDEVGKRQQNPFRRGTNDDPVYTEEDNTAIRILSDSSPLVVRISFLTYPVKIDITADNTPLESEDSQIDILRRVVAEKDLQDEKFNRYQLLAGRIIPTAEQPT